jgi:hypothetical protein
VVASAVHQFGGVAGECVDPVVEGGCGQGGVEPVPLGDVQWAGVAGDRDVGDAFEQGGLGAEPRVDGAVRDAGGVGYLAQGDRLVALAYEQFPCGAEDPVLCFGDPGRSASLDANVAEVNQPGAYTASLAIAAPTPYSIPAIPVTLTVKPPSTWGKITGTISGTLCHAGTVPIPGATLQIDTWAQHFTLKTDANGQYQLWLDVRNNPLTLIAAKDGWQPQTRQAKLAKLKTVTANFTLLPDTC